jgi:hypothetical protein
MTLALRVAMAALLFVAGISEMSSVFGGIVRSMAWPYSVVGII